VPLVLPIVHCQKKLTKHFHYFLYDSYDDFCDEKEKKNDKKRESDYHSYRDDGSVTKADMRLLIVTIWMLTAEKQ